MAHCKDTDFHYLTVLRKACKLDIPRIKTRARCVCRIVNTKVESSSTHTLMCTYIQKWLHKVLHKSCMMYAGASAYIIHADAQIQRADVNATFALRSVFFMTFETTFLSIRACHFNKRI